MDSYISTSSNTPNNQAERRTAPAGYVTTGLPAATPTGYVSPATRRGTGSYVATEWVRAA